MNIAFYAPLKSPDASRPSGDRLIGRLLIQALEAGGHTVSVASTLRALNRNGDRALTRTSREHAVTERDRLLRLYQRIGAPDAWFTYHLYHKAPDWVGPEVCEALGIPYVVAEASFAPKQERGPWAEGHARVRYCLERCAAVAVLNPDDHECLMPVLRAGTCLINLPAFVDTARFAGPAYRAQTARRLGLDGNRLWLVAIAMMRPGDKLASYTQLARALDVVTTPSSRWQLCVVGDGLARDNVEAVFENHGVHNVRFAGALDPDSVASILPAFDMMVWPAVNEAIGMAMLEAQAAGIPVITADRAGVATVVAHEQTGLLSAEGDVGAFARNIDLLLGSDTRRRSFSDAARSRAQREHSIGSAALRLNALLKATGAGS